MCLHHHNHPDSILICNHSIPENNREEICSLLNDGDMRNKSVKYFIKLKELSREKHNFFLF